MFAGALRQALILLFMLKKILGYDREKNNFYELP
jgi:hypothetical protein